MKTYSSQPSPATASARKSSTPARGPRSTRRAPRRRSRSSSKISTGAATTTEARRMMPADGLDADPQQDAILFGSAGDPDIPDHITLWGLRLAICQGSINTPTCGRPASCRASSPLRHVAGPETGLGDRARKLGRRICRRRRPRAPGPAGGGRDRRLDHDPRRRRRASCASPSLAQIAAAQAADGRHQVQRAAPRHGDVGRDRG